MEDEPLPGQRQDADVSTPALTRVVHLVEEVALGDENSYEARRLTVSAEDAVAVLTDPALAQVGVRWVSPGQSVRIVKLLDAVEPRTKGRGGGGTFPGFVGPTLAQGRGDTHVLRGAAVVVAGYLPRAQEAVLDMSGPGAELSPLALTHNLVVEFTPADGAGWEAVEEALRRGMLALATRLAETALDATPDAVEVLPGLVPPAGSGLPRVAALTNLQTQGAFKDVFVYGRSFGAALPTLVDANELEDGAVVSGQYGHPGLKNPTFVHQNHPVVAALRSRHGRDLEFVGVVLSPEPVDQGQKELMAAHAARLCAAAGLDGLVVTKEGGGNADGDMSLKMDALEELGLAAVGLFAEMAGPDGTGPSLVVPPNRATAMVSTGNYDERLILPAVDEAVGGDQLALLGVPAGSEMELPTAVVYCSLSPLGASRLTCQEGTEVAEEAALAGPGREDGPVRIVHYINQFFAGKGGEDAAGTAPARVDGAVGPGRRLQQLLGEGHEVVATVYCGDDYAAGEPGAVEEILALIQEAEPDLVVAGPAFTSGRYGLACGRVASAATAAGIVAMAAMHEDNPGLDEAAPAPVVASGAAAREMGPSLERLAGAVDAVLDGRPFTAAEGRIGKVPRRNVVSDRTGAERAVELLLARLGGDREATEIPLPRFDRVAPAAPVADPAQAVVALVTEGAVVPEGNPDNLESARATRWLRYSLEGLDALPADRFQSVHGGFSTQWANADPNRVLPLDVARQLEAEGAIGRLHGEYFVTAGNGTTVANARKFGVELAAALRHAEVQAAILTST